MYKGPQNPILMIKAPILVGLGLDAPQCAVALVLAANGFELHEQEKADKEEQEAATKIQAV